MKYFTLDWWMGNEEEGAVDRFSAYREYFMQIRRELAAPLASLPKEFRNDGLKGPF